MNRDAPPAIPFPREPMDAAAHDAPTAWRPRRPGPESPAVPSIFGLTGSRSTTLAELVVAAAANLAEPTTAVPKRASVTAIAPTGTTAAKDHAATPGMAAVHDLAATNGATGARGTAAATNPVDTRSRATANSIAVARDFARTRGTANARGAADTDGPVGVSGIAGVRTATGADGPVGVKGVAGVRTVAGAAGGAGEGAEPVSLSDFAARRRGGGRRARCR
jgi:hypothetical protein